VHDELWLRKTGAGKRFGHCVVGNRSRFEKGQSIWECLCDCGIAFEAKGARLAFGNKKSCGCKNGLSPDRTMRNELFKSYTNSAAKRGLSWELSDAEFDRLTKEDCSYCGIPPASVWKRAKRRGAYEYNGLDRVDSRLGYTSSNVVTACRDCNYAKNNDTDSEFQAWVSRLVNFHGERLLKSLEPAIAPV